MRPGPFRLLLLLFPLFVCRQLFVVAVPEATSEYNAATDIASVTSVTPTTSLTTPVGLSNHSLLSNHSIKNNSNPEETDTSIEATDTTYLDTPSLPRKKELTVGYLTATKGDLKDKQGLLISGALGLALEEVSWYY